jgi:hypothetical protein
LPRRTLPGLAGGMALLSSILALFQVGQTFLCVALDFLAVLRARAHDQAVQ